MLKNQKNRVCREKNNCFKPFLAKKKVFLMLVLTGFLLFFIGTVSASILPIKQYDESTRTVTIKNTLGLGRDISTIKLTLLM